MATLIYKKLKLSVLSESVSGFNIEYGAVGLLLRSMLYLVCSTTNSYVQCCGSMTFWCGSGSAVLRSMLYLVCSTTNSYVQCCGSMTF
jgi:hypothetical protein